MSAIHNQSHTRLYRIWKNMKSRCSRPNVKNYSSLGISVCEDWQNSFISFKDWADKNGYRENLTIDRIDVEGNYEPSNCRWVDYYTQNQNTRRNSLFTYNGKTQCMAEWCRELGINVTTFCQRIKYGLNPFTGERE